MYPLGEEGDTVLDDVDGDTDDGEDEEEDEDYDCYDVVALDHFA